MTRNWKVFMSAGLTALLVASALPILGQQQKREERLTGVFQEPVGPGPGGPPPGDTFVFVASEMSFDGKPVKGAPYSAQAVTESTQTLSDGNRIVNKSTTAVYRDSEGRTRRELSLRGVGIFAAGSDAPQTIFINDPVAGVNYTLDSRTHTARKMPAFRFEFRTDMAPGKPVTGQAGVAVGRMPLPPPPGEPPMGEGPDMFAFSTAAGTAGQSFVFKRESSADKNTAVSEKLGTQIIEGVAAEGSRTTITIPAGAIGNERGINIVDERWYSPELKTMVMTKHSDPRSGETVYRLTNISREEPPRTLFEVPTDYTLKEGPPTKMRRPLPPQ